MDNTNPLRRYRLAAGMTQIQLSEASGVHRVKICKIERGDIHLSNISLATASALAKALRIAAEQLLDEAGTPAERSLDQ